MPLIITPGQLQQRAEFYQQLAQLTSAGIPIASAFAQIQRSPPARSYRKPASHVLQAINEGCTLIESLESQGSWLPAFDLALLRAGEHSGRLDACFRLLAEYYRDRARIARQMIADLLYPVFLLHFAVFIIPFAQFFSSGDLVQYLAQTFGILLPLYAVVLVIAYAAQSRHGEKWRASVEMLLHPVPLLGTGRYYLALGRLAAALEALLTAGVTIIEAWELAATACGSPRLRRIVLAWRPMVDGGNTPAEALAASRGFPHLFETQYATGEISGQLDESLRTLHRYYQEEGTRKLHAIAQWTPRAVYLVVALAIAFYVVRFYSNYFNMVRDAGGF